MIVLLFSNQYEWTKGTIELLTSTANENFVWVLLRWF